MAETTDPRAALIAASSDPGSDLAEAALWIAVEDCPRVDRGRCLALLDELAAQFRSRRGDGDPVEALAAVLRERLHLRGAGGGDPRAHYLHSVLERGAGIPIACSAVWISVGRRAGLAVDGVGLPGHFCVRVEGRLVDAFGGGEPVDEDDARRIVSRALGAEAGDLEPAWMAAASLRSIVARMSRNLRGCYASLENWALALRAADRCVDLLPDQPAERRDRGLLLWRLGLSRAALGDLRHYLERAPDAPDHGYIAEVVGRLRSSLN